MTKNVAPRPVDANWLLERITPLVNGCEKGNGEVVPTLRRCIEAINQAPTISEQTVVHCEVCKYWIFSGTDKAQCITSGDWFCADGEALKPCQRRKKNLSGSTCSRRRHYAHVAKSRTHTR